MKKYKLLLLTVLAFVSVNGPLYASPRQDFQRSYLKAVRQARERTFERYTSLAYGWASLYGEGVSISKPVNFRVTHFGKYYVRLTNGLKCQINISNADNDTFNFSGMDCLR